VNASLSVSGNGDVEEIDVLVIGAGAAGMTTALVAATEGCSVLLCEKLSMAGGTTARSSGGLWVPGHSQDGDAPELKDVYLDRLLHDSSGAALRAAYLSDAPKAVAYVEAHSEVLFLPLPHPDYHALEGASIRGRSLGAAPFDGRRLSADFGALAPPLSSLVALGCQATSAA